MTVSIALIKDSFDPSLDKDYEWIGSARDIQGKRIFQAHSQRRLNNFDPLLYLEMTFA